MSKRILVVTAIFLGTTFLLMVLMEAGLRREIAILIAMAPGALVLWRLNWLREKTAPPADPVGEAMMRAIAERKKVDPQVGVKIGGKEVYHRVVGAMKDQRGVHVESLLA